LKLAINFSELINDDITSKCTLLGAVIKTRRSHVNVDIVNRLLNAGVNVNEVYGKFSCTALMNICHSIPTLTTISIIERLILFGADLNYQCCNGRNPLIYTFLRPFNILTLEILLKYGADPNISCEEENTPLIIASRSSRCHQYIPMLLQSGANPTLKNNEGKTAIDICDDQAMKDLMVKKAKKFI
jgi:hypothetical protein